MKQTECDAAQCCNKIGRIGNDVDATINQGTAAGVALGVINVLSILAIIDKTVDADMVVVCLIVVILSQLAMAVVTLARLRPMWARRRRLCEDLRKARLQ